MQRRSPLRSLRPLFLCPFFCPAHLQRLDFSHHRASALARFPGVCSCSTAACPCSGVDPPPSPLSGCVHPEVPLRRSALLTLFPQVSARPLGSLLVLEHGVDFPRRSVALAMPSSDFVVLTDDNVLALFSLLARRRAESWNHSRTSRGSWRERGRLVFGAWVAPTSPERLSPGLRSPRISPPGEARASLPRGPRRTDTEGPRARLFQTPSQAACGCPAPAPRTPAGPGLPLLFVATPPAE